MMSTSPSGDVWVVHSHEALLYRQREDVWVVECRMEFDDFLGSAVALASFALAETCVYLNISIEKKTASHSTQARWLGIQEDPLRVDEFPHIEVQDEMLRKIKSMGKSARVIAVAEPSSFLRAQHLFLASSRESAHVKNWIKNRTNGTSTSLANAQLCMACWANPDRPHQTTRLVTICCTVLVIVLMEWQSARQIKQHELTWQSMVHDSLEQQKKPMQHSPFKEWASQIRKFGNEKRANLTALNIQWGGGNIIHTHAQLDRDRKRVPKGCQLISTTRATCVSHKAEK